jgi:hypothetical protein
VGKDYKGWGAKIILHSSCKVWDNKEKSQTWHVWTRRTSQAKKWNGFFLQKWDKLANHYQHVLCNPSLKIWYNQQLLNSIRPKHGGFYCHKKVVQTIHETIHVLDLPCGNHYYNQTSIILVCSRLHHGLQGCLFGENILYSTKICCE